MSGERVREIRIQTARELESRGLADKAIDLYVKAGAPGEAVRLLVAKERYAEAGKLMLETLGVTPEEAGRLEGRSRAAAEKAARCFELGSDAETARRIRRALGGASDAPPAMARPSIAPDVLPATEPRPSIAPGTSPSTSEAPAAMRSFAPPASPSPSTPGTTAGPSARPIASPSPSMVGVKAPSAPPSTTPPSASPSSASPPSASPPSATPSVRPSISAAAPSVRPGPSASARPSPAARAASGAGTSGSSADAGGEKWGRASGWRGGAQGTGATDEMIRQLLEQGKKNAAARVAWDSGRLEDAARWFGESGLDYESGAVLHDLGRLDEAMEALLRVSHDHKRYRVACTKLVDIASKLGRFDFELDRALTQLAKAPPLEASEVPTYLALAELYAKHGFADGARNALDQVLLFDSAHEGARAMLDQLPPPPPPKRGTSMPPARRARAIVAPGTRALPAIPTLDEFVAEARRNAPKPARRAP